MCKQYTKIFTCGNQTLKDHIKKTRQLIMIYILECIILSSEHMNSARVCTRLYFIHVHSELCTCQGELLVFPRSVTPEAATSRMSYVARDVTFLILCANKR